eukprot:CAMPEP_0196200050 /NCGR_PEP_ID=MMETSP0912-20130531/3477_1 /TAXON_ID=49265 /ORGANISM="Thalassiosira rotula, Strain GSO102" /LENGTH=65 /DNA_ID=CAMNT_0041473325 /DNA_START=469 /DNA_END=663 /DNA_ORIENTATION=+
MKVIASLALVASASAFVPATNMVASTRLNAEVVWGDYDDKMWDNDAKKDVYAKWDPTAPRTGLNF